MIYNNLNVLRARHDLTQGALAKQNSVTRQTILAIEKGRYDQSPDPAFKMAYFFRVTVDDIFEYESDDDFPRVKPLRKSKKIV